MLEKTAKLSWIYDAYHLAQSSAALDSGNAIYQQILLHIVDGFDAQSGCLALCSEDRTHLTIVAGIDLPSATIGSSVKMGADILGWVARENAALLLNGSAANDPRFSYHHERAETEIPHSAICWPLKIENLVIGAVSVNRPRDQPAYVQHDLEQGTLILNLISLVLSNVKLHRDQQRRINELKDANRRLEQAQNQLVQSEKLSSIGQLAAGVAHEINNPIGFVSSNLASMEKYMAGVFQMLQAYEGIEATLSNEALAHLQAVKRTIDLPFLKEDIPLLMNESREGIARVKTIVQSLKDFSHADSSDEWQLADVHKGLESTIKMAWNELKYKADIVRQFGDIPPIECLPSQLNQVFLNILVNAGHAIPDAKVGPLGTITVSTALIDDQLTIAISDNGCGIAPQNLKRIFDPFFTTKKVGDGTGLGLSLSYGIIQKHDGRIDVRSELGTGTTFTISLPIRRTGTPSSVELHTTQRTAT